MFVAALIQCFTFCNCGQLVNTAAQDFSRILYSSQWHQLKRIDQRKIVLFMLTQSQREVGFTAGGFTVSLELFATVS
jgi:hypothetical protein